MVAQFIKVSLTYTICIFFVSCFYVVFKTLEIVVLLLEGGYKKIILLVVIKVKSTIVAITVRGCVFFSSKEMNFDININSSRNELTIVTYKVRHDPVAPHTY